ncbi:hypothetical protein [Cardinium endosymbiont of Nabis limbatus]|uniref:hypothetical protein n=1 Tax=Cardinium endosymbiont of Nabis limbatus TaxID=3066217 RepID=UPI003AF37CDC
MTRFTRFKEERLSLQEYEMIVGGGGNASKTYVGDGLYYRGSNLYHDNVDPPKGSLYAFKPGDSAEMKTVKSEMFQDAIGSNPCDEKVKGMHFHPEVFQKRSK